MKQNMTRQRKGAMTLGDLAPAAVAFVVIAVTIGIGATILSTIQTDQVTNTAGCNATAKTSCGYDYNNTQQGLEGMDQLAGFIPTIAVVVAAAVVIGVIAFFRS